MPIVSFVQSDGLLRKVVYVATRRLCNERTRKNISGITVSLLGSVVWSMNWNMEA